jgi:hypothetical protein
MIACATRNAGLVSDKRENDSVPWDISFPLERRTGILRGFHDAIDEPSCTRAFPVTARNGE